MSWMTLGSPRRQKRRAALPLALLLALLSACPALADIVYLYDDLGRLLRVIREDSEAATYHYDAVGNLLEIIRESGVPQITTVATASTSRLTLGQSTTIVITGVNLVGAIITASTGITITTIQSELDTLTVGVSVSPSAPLGTASLTIQTPLGTVTLPLTVVPPPRPAFLTSAGVSVKVAPPPPTVNRNVTASVSVEVAIPGATFMPAPAVTVTFEPVITGVAPDSGVAGAIDILLTLTGAGFTGATDVVFLLNNAADASITVTSLVVNLEGTQATLDVSIAPGAAPGGRVVQVTIPGGSSTEVGTGGNLFTVE